MDLFLCRHLKHGVAVGWVWPQPARPSAYGEHWGMRASSRSGGLAEGAVEDGRALSAKHDRPTHRGGRLDANRSIQQPHCGGISRLQFLPGVQTQQGIGTAQGKEGVALLQAEGHELTVG